MRRHESSGDRRLQELLQEKFHLTGAVLSLVLVTSGASAATFYVDASLERDCTASSYSLVRRNCTGRDGAAYRKIQDAFERLSPGDTLYIRAGTYREAATLAVSGWPRQYITIANYPGERPVLDGRRVEPSREAGLLDIRSRRFTRVRGLTVRNSGYYGIYVVGSHDVTIENTEVANSRHGGMVFRGGSGIRILGCNVHHNNELGLPASHEAVTLEGVRGFEVGYCQVHRNKEEGVDIKYGSTGGTVHHNRVYRNNGPNIYVDAANNIEIFGNELFETGSEKPGIMLGVETNPSREFVYDVSIHNNFVYRNAVGISFWIESGAEPYARFRNVAVYNNLVYQRGGSAGPYLIVRGGAPRNYEDRLVIRDNIFSGSGRPGIVARAELLERFIMDNNLFLSGGVKPTGRRVR